MKLMVCASQEERSCELTLIVNYNSDKSFSSEVTYFVDFYSTTKSLVVLNLLLISPLISSRCLHVRSLIFVSFKTYFDCNCKERVQIKFATVAVNTSILYSHYIRYLHKCT